MTDTTISNVAMAVGFSNFSYFSTLFKKEVSMTPQEYRKG
jgi:two-component system response regulator YesN